MYFLKPGHTIQSQDAAIFYLHSCGWYPHPSRKTSFGTLPTVALMVTFCECTSQGTGTKGDTHQGQS